MLFSISGGNNLTLAFVENKDRWCVLLARKYNGLNRVPEPDPPVLFGRYTTERDVRRVEVEERRSWRIMKVSTLQDGRADIVDYHLRL